MSKPRVIIADTDISYLLPLQEKMVEDYFDQINLEIISKREYFEKFFQMPQKADVLILSEDLFSTNLYMHDISKMFVLSESSAKKSEDTENIEYIYKYSTLREVFNEIVSKCKDVFKVSSGQKEGTRVVLISSANGGAGKTTVAMGLAACLARNYKNVLYINAACIQSFQHWLSNAAPITALDIYAKLMNSTEEIYGQLKRVIRKELFDYLPPFKASLLSLGVQFSVYERIIHAIRKSGEYDFIIVDTESVFNEDMTSLMHIADKVMVVTNQTRAAVNATQLLVANINGLGTDKYIFVCNNYEKEKKNAAQDSNALRKVSVVDYVEHFEDYENMTITDLVKEESMQRLTFLLI